jgi:WD40 repeat protein
MGAVYQAQHRLMGRTVALKVINGSLLNDPTAVARFRREVQAAAQLAHPNIVTAHDAEQAGDTHFLVMEYVEGTDLAAVVQRKGALPVTHACNYVRQAALGLQHAFEQGMVHRDIKPHNLMLMRSGQVKILDFGLARFASEGGPGANLTATNSMMGTPDYVAPEQASDARTADIRADIYSLGCTLYCLLTGRPPFGDRTLLAKIVAHSQEAPRPVTDYRADVPPEVVAILERMLAKDPAQRFQTPAEVAQALAPFARSTGSSATGPARQPPAPALADAETLPASRPSAVDSPKAAPPRRRGVLTALVAVGLAAAAGAGYWVYTSFRDRREPPPPVAGPELPKNPAVPLPHREGEVWHFEGHKDEVWAVAFSPDGRSILSAAGSVYRDGKWHESHDPTLRLWDVASGKQVHCFTGHEGAIFSIAFSRDGRFALSGSHDGTLRLWDVAGGKQVRCFRGGDGQDEDKRKVWSVALSPDGHRALCGSEDGVVQLWDVDRGTLLQSFPAHTAGRIVWSVAFSPDGRRALSGSADHTVRWWDLDGGLASGKSWTHPVIVRGVAFFPVGRRVVAAGGRRGAAQVRDVETAEVVKTLDVADDDRRMLTSLAVSPSGRRVLVGSLDSVLRLWDIESGEVVWKAGKEGVAVLAVAYSPDGRFAVSGGNDNVVRVWGLPPE